MWMDRIAEEATRILDSQDRKQTVASDSLFLLSYRSRIILRCLIFILKASTEFSHTSLFGVQDCLVIQSLKRKFARESKMS